MKILYHHRTGSKDGQAVHIQELIEAFRRLGHEVVVVGPRLTEKQDFGGESRLVSAIRSTLPGFLYELLEFSYSFVAFARLWKARRVHAPDVLYERYNLYMLAGAWLRSLTGIPYVLEVNGPLYEERLRYGGISLKFFARWSQVATWRRADRVLPVTRVLAQFVLAAGVPERRIEVIANGVDLSRFAGGLRKSSAKSRFGLENCLVLGFIGFVREWHGLSMAIELLADPKIPPGVRLLIVGDGPGRPVLERAARELGVEERVVFTGLLDREETPAAVAAFDVALQPAVTPYASPLKLFEYMALGCAIVAPKMPNIEEVLSDGDSALLFDPDDAASFRAAILRVCGDRELRRKLGASARRRIDAGGYTWDRNAERLDELIREI